MTVDAVVVGAGPNGLAAAVTLARAGLSVEVLEANDWIGGGTATREVTLPGFRHDLASAVHPMALASPFFREFELSDRVDLIVPEVSYAHPVSSHAGVAYRDLDRTVEELGRDGSTYERLLRPIVERADDAADFAMSSLLRPPQHLAATAAMTLGTGWQGTPAWGWGFDDDVAPSMLTGVAAHVIGRHPRLSVAGAGLLLSALAHAGGWPVPRGGSQSIADAMVADLQAHGGRVRTGVDVTSLAELDYAKVRLLDVSAGSLEQIGRDRLPDRYRRALRGLRPGPGVSKLDLALDGPVPWSDKRLSQAPTIHLGGTRAQIRQSEGEVAAGRLPEAPYVLLVQPSVVDPTRAPQGKAVLWAYTHVPYGCSVDRSDVILDTIEQHAPGTRDLVLGSHAFPASRLHEVSANFAGGDFASGAVSMRQLARRPILSPTPWRTPVAGTYVCSGSTTPGPSVHGMAGWSAARTALEDLGIDAPSLSIKR
ncbi:phytoene desaturase family protein [Demetria terragena]|uniref:phytoene desaturase family protein n=1 Tax=Demetria terragena TaxID=63959 RepID=UPI0003A71C7E|nr:NAD(P)/FAD-dependent oxidoreductase [Demetria terragena]